MKNITSEMNHYKDAIRHLWNSAFRPIDEPLYYGECLEIFSEIHALTFQALVCAPNGIDPPKLFTVDPIPSLRVVPTTDLSIPIMINRTFPASGYWDDPVDRVNAADLHLVFMCYFDWDEYSSMDCRYYRVRILDSKSYPDLIGRDALVESFMANVFLDKPECNNNETINSYQP